MNKRAFEIDTVEMPRLCEQLRTAEEHCHRQSTVSMEPEGDGKEHNPTPRRQSQEIGNDFLPLEFEDIVHKAKELKTEKLCCELMAGVLERQVQEEQARK